MISDEVQVRPSPIHGSGVFTCIDLEEDWYDTIHGVVVPDELSNLYCFEIDEKDSFEPYAPYRYLNHSDDPNCEAEMGRENKGITYLVALRNIKAGEELTIAYGGNEFSRKNETD